MDDEPGVKGGLNSRRSATARWIDRMEQVMGRPLDLQQEQEDEVPLWWPRTGADLRFLVTILLRGVREIGDSAPKEMETTNIVVALTPTIPGREIVDSALPSLWGFCLISPPRDRRRFFRRRLGRGLGVSLRAVHVGVCPGTQ